MKMNKRVVELSVVGPLKPAVLQTGWVSLLKLVVWFNNGNREYTQILYLAGYQQSNMCVWEFVLHIIRMYVYLYVIYTAPVKSLGTPIENHLFSQNPKHTARLQKYYIIL